MNVYIQVSQMQVAYSRQTSFLVFNRRNYNTVYMCSLSESVSINPINNAMSPDHTGLWNDKLEQRFNEVCDQLLLNRLMISLSWMDTYTHCGTACTGGVYWTDTMHALHQMRCYSGQQQEHGAHRTAACCYIAGRPSTLHLLCWYGL